MKRVFELGIWLLLCSFFWAGIILVQPFRKTKYGKRFITFIDDVDLLAFEIREFGIVSAIRSWRDWHER